MFSKISARIGGASACIVLGRVLYGHQSSECEGRMNNRIVCVTGGSSGIGAATCTLLAKEGAKVVIADINETLGRSLAEEIGGYFVKLDVSCEDDWLYVMNAIELKYGKLDGLVNNAGIALGGNIETTSTESWKKLQSIHVDGTFYGCKHGIGLMKKGGSGGSIVNLSSLAGLRPSAELMAYSVVKGGIRTLSKSVAAHCQQQKYDIRCNSIHPGMIDSPMTRGFFSAQGVNIQGPEGAPARKHLAIGECSDVANLILFLLSDESQHITAAEIPIDRGKLYTIADYK